MKTESQQTVDVTPSPVNGGGVIVVKESTDRELVSAVLSGNRDAFESIVDRHQQPLYFYLYRLVKNQESAEELTQETLLRAWEKLELWKDGGSFRGWLITMARRQAMTWFRSQKSRGRDRESSLEDHPVGETLQGRGSDHAVENVVQMERAEILEQAIGSLSSGIQELIHLYYREDLPVIEIAKILDKKESAVKVALHRARIELKNHIHSLSKGQEL